MDTSKFEINIYKSKRRFALIFYVLDALLIIGSIVINSIAFSNVSFVSQDREMNEFFSEISNKNVSYFYSKTTFHNKNQKSSERMFKMLYTKNLSDDGYQHILTVEDEDGILESTPSFGKTALPFISSITNSLVYTNKEDPPCFETVLINLFKYRDRKEEISYDPKKFDGFVYIPDFFADYIIENNNNISSYNDLLDNEIPFSLTIKGNKLDYKIANIFHLNGFQERYCDGVITKTTYGYSKLFKDFLGNFCFVPNTSSILKLSNNFNLSLASVLSPKRFLLVDTFKTIQKTIESRADSADFDLFYSDSAKIIHYESSSAISKAFLEDEANGDWSFKIISIIVYFLSITFLSFVFYKYFKEKSFYIFALSEVGGMILLLFVFSIFKLTPLFGVISLYFNSITIITILLYLLSFLLLSSSFFAIKKGSK